MLRRLARAVPATIRRLARSVQGRLEARLINLHEGLTIGPGTVYSRANLDGIVPQLVTIGTGCVFAPNSVVLTHDASPFPTMGCYRIAPVIIGDRVFVGYGAVILPGVQVGNDVVIGAGAVVTSNVPANSVVAGVPARVIGSWPSADMASDELFTPPFEPGHVPTRRDIRRFQSQILGRMRRSAL